VDSFLRSRSNATEIGSPPEFLSLMSRTAAAENLAEMLESEGIRVSSIRFGPMAAQYPTGRSPKSHSINRYVEAFLLIYPFKSDLCLQQQAFLANIWYMRWTPTLLSSNDLPKDWQGSFDVLMRKISGQLTVQDSRLLTILHGIVQSRYVHLDRNLDLRHDFICRHPKYTYTIGVYPVLRLALRSAPISARMAAKSLMRWVKSWERAT
jgi:hypothetical protein